MKSERCTTTDCYRAAVTLSGKCKQCYAYFHRWHKRNSPAAMRARQAQIALWDNRLAEMLRPKKVKTRART